MTCSFPVNEGMNCSKGVTRSVSGLLGRDCSLRVSMSSGWDAADNELLGGLLMVIPSLCKVVLEALGYEPEETAGMLALAKVPVPLLVLDTLDSRSRSMVRMIEISRRAQCGVDGCVRRPRIGLLGGRAVSEAHNGREAYLERLPMADALRTGRKTRVRAQSIGGKQTGYDAVRVRPSQPWQTKVAFRACCAQCLLQVSRVLLRFRRPSVAKSWPRVTEWAPQAPGEPVHQMRKPNDHQFPRQIAQHI